MMEVKHFDSPDETRPLPKASVQVVKVGNNTLMRGTFEPGWKWSECVKPSAGTDSCMVHHVLYLVSGRMMVQMNDGTRQELKPGCASVVPPGHDAWIVGNEPCVAVDFTGGEVYGKK